MSDWPGLLAFPAGDVLISNNTLHSLGSATMNTPASSVWLAANRAIFVPFRITAPILVSALWVANGAAVSGNLDMGIYDAFGTRLVSKGSTAQAGTTTIQVLDVTDTLIGPGLFYLALALDNSTGAFIRLNLTQNSCKAMGMAQMGSALPLPATATFASMGTGYLAIAGLSGKVVV